MVLRRDIRQGEGGRGLMTKKKREPGIRSEMEGEKKPVLMRQLEMDSRGIHGEMKRRSATAAIITIRIWDESISIQGKVG